MKLQFTARQDNATPQASPRPNFPNIKDGPAFEFGTWDQSSRNQATSGFSFRGNTSVQKTDRTGRTFQYTCKYKKQVEPATSKTFQYTCKVQKQVEPAKHFNIHVKYKKQIGLAEHFNIHVKYKKRDRTGKTFQYTCKVQKNR